MFKCLLEGANDKLLKIYLYTKVNWKSLQFLKV